MISSMHTCMQKIPRLNEQLFYAEEERAMETWKVQIMNKILHWQAWPQPSPQHQQVAAKARRSSKLKDFSPNSILLIRLERVKLQVGLSLDIEEAQTF